MTTALAQRPVPHARSSSGEFTGTGRLLRLYLRRDRIVLPLWVLLLSVSPASVYVGSIESVYPTEADRVSFMNSILASPAQLAMYGPIYNSSLGATGIWKAGPFYALLAIAVILTVIRHTRAEEETGRAELLDSTAVGRYANLTAALILTFGASITTGLIATVALFGTDVPASGSIAYGLALAGSGIVFTAVAAVAAQLSTGARTARGIALGTLGAMFALRAVGDAGSGALSWLSPLGWSLQVRPYAGERWWVPLLHVTTAVLLTGLAYMLRARRDVGAGLIAERPGTPSASAALSGPLGLAWRLHRGTILAWTLGLGLYALLLGSVVHGIGDELGSSEGIRDMIARLGGTDALEDAMITMAFTILAVGAAALAVSAALRLYYEESLAHAEAVLSGAVGRIRWAASHIVFAVVGPTVAILVAGLVTGLAYGLAADDVRGKVPEVLGAAAVQLPGIWMLVGITVALFGLVPRLTPVVWGVLTAFVALFLLGSVSGVPQWVLDLQPFTHAPKLPGAEFEAAPLIWLLVIDAALLVAGLLGFRNRDLR